MNNYSLHNPNDKQQKVSILTVMKKLLILMKDEKANLLWASLATLITTGLNLWAPVVIGHTVDTYIQGRNFHGVLVSAALLLSIYIGALIAQYFQTLLMGKVGQNVLYNLRNAVFQKLQSLPVAFFNQNKAGDLISRINNDTDKLNQFFSQSLIQFVSSIITIIGAGIFVLSLNLKLGAAAIAPAVTLIFFTRLLTPWIKKKNALSLKNIGGLSGEISESLENFKVVVAFNRRDYFRKKFNEVNESNYKTALGAGIANNTLNPTYGLANNLAQIIVIGYGLFLITQGMFTLGLLISFLSYVNRLYDPLRHMAAVWASFQTALAAWDRVQAILSLDSDLVTVPSTQTKTTSSLLEFNGVHFGYPNGKEVLHNINFSLEKGKIYALVGPTGGGKTTTASLMARLYDPTKGTVFFEGKDMKSYSPEERAQKIGFILQEPFLFTGTVRENIIYGNKKYQGYSSEQLEQVIEGEGLSTLLERFDNRLDTAVSASGGTLSLGQKQLVAFMRAVLRHPDLLILDEATANIDTVTEQLLEEILKKLPASTTRVIIAHRLNTIENADEIFFINDGEVTPAGSMDHAIHMLLDEKRRS